MLSATLGRTSGHTSFRNRIAGIAGACALAAAMALNAFAPVAAYADTNAATTPENISVTKEVTSQDGGATPAGTFDFTVTPYSTDGDTNALPPALQNFQISVPSSSNGLAVGHVTGDAFLPADPNATFPHAGIYRYIVRETKGNIPGLTYSTAGYTVDVAIANDPDNAGKLKYGIILVYKQETPGTPGDADKKIDPTPGSSDETHTKVDPKASQFIFTNSVDNHEDNKLKVSKSVTGAYANTDQAFQFKIALTLPQGYDVDIIKATLVGGNGGTIEFKKAEQFTATVEMKNGYILSFPGSLPTGTTVTVTEAQTEIGKTGRNWKASAMFNNAAVNDTDDTDGFSGSGAVDYAPGKDNSFVVTNNDDSTTPTGILINNAPAILMIAIAAGGLGFYVYSRKRALQVR